MATELDLLYLTHPQKLAESDQHRHQTTLLNPSSTAGPWMWNPKQAVQFQDDDDDSWEVRAFAEDTNHAMGTTWPPRSYTCTFCRREFRSAQALGGHMNVHRRDRARLHQTQPSSNNSTTTAAAASSAASSSALLIPTQEFVANGRGLCLLYSLPNPNGVFTATATTMNACMDSPSHLLSISPYPPHTLISPFSTSINFPVASPAINSSICDQYSTCNTEPSASVEVLDLELRLGRSSSPS